MVADRFSLIRSCAHSSDGHENGTQHFLTGKKPARPNDKESEHPDPGAVFKKLHPAARRPVPGYVSLNCGGFEYGGPGYLGNTCKPFAVRHDTNHPRFAVHSLSVAGERGRFDDRLALRRSFETARREAEPVMDVMDDHGREAARILTGPDAERAFQLWREPGRVREKYGRTRCGQDFLLARRLVEHGVGFVTVDFRAVEGALAHTWDDHATGWNIFEQMKLRLPVFDRALAALIEDLHARGLDKRVLLVVTGEFGRTPRIAISEGRPGRDHYSGAMSILVSGGGMEMGLVVGSTTSKGEGPKDRPLTPSDFLATVYGFLGIDPGRMMAGPGGRPLPLLDGGVPIKELMGT